MSPDRWRQLEHLYHGALEREPAHRDAFLSAACASDPDLRREVESLVAHASGENRLDHPAWQGVRIGPYEILEKIGAGGMGEVWKARDTRLDRLVALKWARVRFSERFEREARAVAALNHPHICTLYDIGPDYLVMEYVEGVPLKGPLPLAQASRYGLQILEALEAAHRAGIVHRDLKPPNILVNKQGVKLLDFGLARRIAAPQAEHTSAPTSPITAEGTMIGTPQYMAPEQIQGREPDARTDIFAFGCVLYEMLTGRRAFQGETPASLIAAILHIEPPSVSTVQPHVPAALARVVNTCLAKDPDERWQTATDIRHALVLATDQQSASPRRPWLLPALLAAAVSLAVAVTWFLLRGAQHPQALAAVPMQFVLARPENTVDPGSMGTQTLAPLAVSPDGRAVAMVESDALGRSYVWVRRFDSVAPVRLDATLGASFAFWSPDSQHLGFGADRSLKRIAVAGGAVQVITDRGTQGSWGADGTVLFSRAGSLYRVSALGGTPSLVAAPDQKDGETACYWPDFLPDGKHFLYLATHRNSDEDAIYLREIGSSQKARLVTSRAKAYYAPPGYLIYARDRSLFAQRLLPGNFRLQSEAIPILDNLANLVNGGRTMIGFSVSENGVLAYRADLNKRRLVWYDRTGVRSPAEDEGGFRGVALSPDGKRAMQFFGNRLCMRDLMIGAVACFDLAPRVPLGINGSWSPDSRRFVMALRTGPKWDLLEIKINSGSTSVIYSDAAPIYAPAWSADGRFMIFHSADGSGTRVYLLPLSGERKPRLLFQTSAYPDYLPISPDGRFVTYASNELGRYEIYVAPLNSIADRLQISTSGGVQPTWRGDGRELFYLSPDGKIIGVAFTPGSPPRVGPPRPLFQTRARPAYIGRLYSPAPDGRRFLVVEPDQPDVGDLNVILHWDAVLRR